MCGPAAPAVMGWVAVALTAASTVIQADSQRKQAAAYEAIGEENQRVAEANAKQATQVGNLDEQRHREQVRKVRASQQAAMASSGAVVDSGTFGNLADDLAAAGEYDAMTIRANAARQAWQFRTGGEINRMESRAKASASRWGAAGTLLGGGAQAFGMASQIPKKTPPTT